MPAKRYHGHLAETPGCDVADVKLELKSIGKGSK